MSSLLAWNQILPLLGVSVKGSVLPAVVTCPLCTTGRCHVYQDPVVEGQWYWCDACESAGDMLELAMRVWQLGPRAAALKAHELGLGLPAMALSETAAEEYQRQRLGPRKAAYQFWHDALKHFQTASSSEIRLLQNRLGIRGTNIRDLQFVGSADMKTIKRFLSPSAEGRPHHHKVHYFGGKGWSVVLVIPFWDLPGRLCGFLFAGRELSRSTDFVYRMVPEFRTADGTVEAGLTMLGTAFLSTPEFHDTLFVLNDPLLAVRLQFRWLRDNLVPLPLTAAYGNGRFRTQHTWQSLPTRDIVFWAPQMTHQLLADARRANASISTLSVSDRELDLNLRHRSILDWFRTIRHHRQPWGHVLQQVLQRLPLHRREDLLADMGFSDEDRRKFIQGCQPELREALEQLYVGRPRTRQILYSRWNIVERDDCWFLGSDGPCICDFVVRIEQILHAAASNRTYYRGTILYQGQTIPFLERTDWVDKKGLWPWCRDRIIQQGLGVPVFNTTWRRHAMELALRFWPAKIVAGVDAVGWDSTRRQFNFPTFAIKLGGQVDTDHPGLFSDPRVPGKMLRPPQSLGKPAVEALSERNDETRIFFAVMAAVASNIVAPAINGTPVGTVLDGHGAQSIGQMAAIYLGCPEITSPTPEQLEQAPHPWPQLIHLENTEVQPFQRWLATGNRQAILLAPHATAQVLGVKRQWNIIRCDRKLGSMQLLTGTATQVLPEYLRDLCDRDLQFRHEHQDGARNVLDDIAQWLLRRYGGNPHTVMTAGEVLETPNEVPATQYAVELIYNLCQAGELETVRTEYCKDIPTGCLVLQHKQGVIWVPQRYIIDRIERAAGIAPDVLLMTKAFADASALVKECTVAQQRGWLLNLEWFEGQIEFLKTQVIE